MTKFDVIQHILMLWPFQMTNWANQFPVDKGHSVFAKVEELVRVVFNRLDKFSWVWRFHDCCRLKILWGMKLLMSMWLKVSEFLQLLPLPLLFLANFSPVNRFFFPSLGTGLTEQWGWSDVFWTSFWTFTVINFSPWPPLKWAFRIWRKIPGLEL